VSGAPSTASSNAELQQWDPIFARQIYTVYIMAFIQWNYVQY